MKKFLVLFVAVFFMVSVIGVYQAFSADKIMKVVDQKAAKGRGTTTSKNANIKKNTDINPPVQSAIKAPPAKSDNKTRAYYPTFTADNYTPYYIKVYINGDYVGTVAPYGKAAGDYAVGTYSIYGIAYFSDGSTLEWGPKTVFLDSDYTLNLNH
jgi:hypothetical protein